MHNILKVLANEHRIKILKNLQDKDDFICICEFDDIIDRDRSVIYRHFQKLESVGLLETRKINGRVECRLRDPDKVETLFDAIKDLENM